MTDAPDLVLIDGSSYLYRAFHALPPLTNSRGEPTGAVFGVVNMLLKSLKDHDPRHVAVVFDAPGRTFRDELFAEYKAHRVPMPDDLRAQVEPLLAIVRAMGLPVLRIEGVEADDVIGTLARRAASHGLSVLISTSDKDMTQLVDGRIRLINTMSGSLLDREGVKARFGVWPEQMIDYLALVGDSSDNIPGIDKVGPKTAAKWLNQYGSLDEIVANAGCIEGRVGENLRAGLETLALARRLATIHTDLPLDTKTDDLTPQPADVDRLRELYERFELRTLLRQLQVRGDTAHTTGHATPADTPLVEDDTTLFTAGRALGRMPREYETIFEWVQFERWLERLQGAALIAFDTETTSLDYMTAEIVGVSFSVEPGRAAYVPLRHDYAGAPVQLDRDRVLEALRPLLEDPARDKLGHHLKYDAHVLANHGVTLAGQRFDTMLESYVWNSVATRHDMDSMAEHYLGIRTIRYEDVAGKGAKQIPFNQVLVEAGAEYAAEDADVTLRLHRALWPRLAAHPQLKELYECFEQPLVPVLQKMERRGVLLDREKLRAQSRELGRRLGEIQAAAHHEAGHAFNLESPKQLQQILFERLQLPVLRRTPTGQPSTAEDVLEELAASFPLPRMVLDYRSLAKLRSTYTEKLPGLVNPHTGRVHTSYHQAVAQTGRLSSSDPNLQNIPVRTAEGRRIREAFIAPPGHVLMAADYSQIELRIMAHLSGDPALRRAFAEGLDVHRATAAEIFAVPLADVNPDQRRMAKTINFGLIYGMSAFGLAQRLGLERGEAQRYIDVYFSRYPGVKRYMDETREQARRDGFVTTVYGRRLYLPDIRARNRQMQQYAERAAINAPMQGTAADIIKRAMIEVEDWCERGHVAARLIMQVHDELVLEVHEDAVEEVRKAVAAHMTDAARLSVPLVTDVGVGLNWDEAH
ncbi:MAG: DNA polymerase I [Gammaproteobacteria bacterium]|nr:DNA polymerase I [Gammaproteobacteria bacterium]